MNFDPMLQSDEYGHPPPDASELFLNTQIDHYLPQRTFEAGTSGDVLLPTTQPSDLSNISSTTLHDTCSLDEKENEIPEQSANMSHEAHSLLGQHVLVNTERATDTSLRAFDEFYVHHERILKHPGQELGSTE